MPCYAMLCHVMPQGLGWDVCGYLGYLGGFHSKVSTERWSRDGLEIVEVPSIGSAGCLLGLGLPAGQLGAFRTMMILLILLLETHVLKTVINHPPVITILIGAINGYGYHSQSWVAKMTLFYPHQPSLTIINYQYPSLTIIY